MCFFSALCFLTTTVSNATQMPTTRIYLSSASVLNFLGFLGQHSHTKCALSIRESTSVDSATGERRPNEPRLVILLAVGLFVSLPLRMADEMPETWRLTFRVCPGKPPLARNRGPQDPARPEGRAAHSTYIPTPRRGGGRSGANPVGHQTPDNDTVSTRYPGHRWQPGDHRQHLHHRDRSTPG